MGDKESMTEEEQLKVCPLSGERGKMFVIRVIKRDGGVELVPTIKCLWCGEKLKNV